MPVCFALKLSIALLNSCYTDEYNPEQYLYSFFTHAYVIAIALTLALPIALLLVVVLVPVPVLV